jgi:hypothetical protein
MNCVISIAAWLQPTRACLLPLGLAAALSASGCGAAHDAEGAKTARQTPLAASPRGAPADTAQSDLAVASDDEEEWVPVTGSDTVIVDNLELLTDGAAVQVAPSDGATATAANASQDER